MTLSKVRESPLAMIVAVSDNNVIGVDGDLPWRLSADLKNFKRLTTGHCMIMGRKTFDSIGRLLPKRTTVIVTRNQDFAFEGALIAHSIPEALTLCGKDETPFLIGGAEIYRQGLPFVNELFLTRVHATIEGDTFLPPIDWDRWELLENQRFEADAENEVAFSFRRYRLID